jgi:hypothetical protein
MEFEAVVRGEAYRFSFLDVTSVLVSGRQGEYIFYKNNIWRCADDLPVELVKEFGKIIDGHLQFSRHV